MELSDIRTFKYISEKNMNESDAELFSNIVIFANCKLHITVLMNCFFYFSGGL